MNQAPDLLARQRRTLFFVGAVLFAQTVNTFFLWRVYGGFPLWSGLATLGLTLFGLSALRRYRRLRALTAAPARPGKKRRRLRDPQRSRG